MELKISAEEVLEIIKKRITGTSTVLKADDISSINFDYDNIAETVIGVTVNLKSNAY